ncbi:unnamed protein product [Peronospora farinosa]|uniref:PIPK domain-containing protein n=1 Tax=Peronospora farinosa TaxID=134698 RepID=A0ABN8BX30_9STRA|nr:unnamed protein product [Peronospora farinosa]
MSTKVIIPAKRDLSVSINDVLPELLAVKTISLSPDRRRPRSPSPQNSRLASPTSNAIETVSFVNNSKSTCVSTLSSIELDSNVTIKNANTEAELTSLASKAIAEANLSLLEKRMRVGKSKLKHSRSFRVPAGNVINLQHEKYALTYGMMCGIRDSAGLQKSFRQRLTMDDFMLVDKKVFSANAQLRHPFKFKDYSPGVFHQVRRHFGVDLADYMLTLSGDFNFIEFMSNSKSGQFFFYSHDGRFMIKTQTKDESKFLRRVLPHYYKFVMENPNTLMTRFYGMHRVEMHHLRKKMHFVIMASVFDTPLEIHARYDLKGSRIGRHASAKEHERGNAGVLKDNDLLDKGFHLQMSVAQRTMFLIQLRKDVDFLKRMKIMDYSLLVGVHDSNCTRDDLCTSSAMSDSPMSVTLQQEGGYNYLPTAHTGLYSDFVHVPMLRPCRSTSMPESGAQLQPPLILSAITNIRTRLALSSLNNSTWSDGCADLNLDSDNDFDLDDSTSSEGGFGRSFDAAFGEYCSQANGSSAGSLPSTPKDAAAVPPLSPRLFDAAAYADYSESVFCRDDGGICGRDQHGRKNGFVYFLGIIDILQQYNTRKIAETFFKGLRHNRKHISAVEPEFYGDRFIEYMEKHVVQDDTMISLRPSSSSSSVLETQTCSNDNV